MGGWAVLDGELLPLGEAKIGVDDPGLTLGWSVFETMVARGGQVREVEAHLDRLEASCAAARLPAPPREVLIAEVDRLVGRVGDARLRITLTGGGRRILTATRLDPSRRHQPVRAARGPHRDEPFLGGAVKHGSRLPWVLAVAASGADEVLLVDDQGRFTEGTMAAILAVIDGVLWTAPHDGRILPSTTCLTILRRAEARGIEVRREGPPAEGPWDALYVASATRDLAPVISLDGQALPGWDPVGRGLMPRGDP